MPKTVPIKIYRIAGTTLNRETTRQWLDDLGVKTYKIPDPKAATDAAALISMGGKRCYKSFELGLNPNIKKIREDLVEYFDNVLKSGHGSILEHATYTYAIENVSRVFTAEMNRHRAGWAISEGSMRFIRYTPELNEKGESLPNSGISYWQPTSITDNENDPPEAKKRKEKTREVFQRAFGQMEKNYQDLLDIWDMDEDNTLFPYKKAVTSCLRRIIGMGVATGGIWTGNIRALRHVITMRADKAAEEEIFYVFSNIAKDLLENEPLLFGDFQKTTEGYWKPKYWKV